MTLKEIVQELALEYNRLLEISVCGNDVIRMAEVLQHNRALVIQLTSQIKAENIEASAPDD